ncbi:MAG: hypothetical protein JWM27_509 [Gemmatimonadetes bacterium]|nr:hypothetical protein [Gemmatimonadota bacterium]
MSAGAWHVVTGEYPPDRGGVGDHTRVLAAALAADGAEVHVWTGGDSTGTLGADGARVHRAAGAWDGAGLRRLSAEMDAFASPRRVLVQYAPRAYGRNGMNLGFCRWVHGRRGAGDDVRVMFHEPFFPFGRQALRRNALAAVNHAMAAVLLRAACRAYVSIPAWEPMLRPLAPGRLGRMRWLPVGSTIPREDDDGAVDAIRAGLPGRDGGRPIVGHFGTYGDAVASLLASTLRRIRRAEPEVVVLLLGDGGPGFADALTAVDACFRGRIVAPGYLSPRDVSLHLQACDVLVQPYPDGASSRRTTLMAGMANGAAVVSTAGALTEDDWSACPVPLAPAGDADALARAACDLLRDPAAAAEIGAAGRRFYDARFSVRCALEVLGGEGV